MFNARVAAVTENFWDVLQLETGAGGSPPLPGKTPFMTAAGAVVSYDVWEAFGRDPQILGRVMTAGDRPYRIVAIAPRGFHGIHLESVFDCWIPLDAGAAQYDRGSRRLRVLGRLAPGASLERLQDTLNAASVELARLYPDTNKGTIRSADDPRRFTAMRYSRVNPAVRPQVALLAVVLLGATCLLLLSACVNAGSLLLSRGAARRNEFAIKTALGADRTRLMRQLLLESLVLAISGAAAGVLAATWTAGAIPALFAPEQARLLDTHVALRVMLITLAVGAAAGVLFGIAPAVASTRSLSPEVLRGDPANVGEPPGSARLRMALVGAQLALSTIFLIGSALLTKVVDNALNINRSRAAGSVVMASIETYDTGYRDAALRRLERLASLSRTGWVAVPPLTRPPRRQFRIDHGATSEFVEFDVNFASPRYFSAMFIPVVDGRFYTADDEAAQAEVAIVNEALAQRYFADRAVGHSLTDALGRTVEIVGVVRTRSYRAFEGPPQPTVYYPMSRATARGFYAVVRSRDDALNMEHDLLDVLRSAGQTTKLEVLSFDTHVSRALATDRLIVTLVAACGVFALGLALMGAYAVLADMVRRRTREIGLRIALGAGPWQIIRLFVVSTLAPVFAGVTAGVLGAELIVRVGRSLVYGVPSIEATLLVTVGAGLSSIVIAVLVPPARRSLRVSPLLTLRERP
jgi:predicted permease